jgi:hypothetical protein
MASDTFHPFPELPLELRRLVWLYALPQSNRVEAHLTHIPKKSIPTRSKNTEAARFKQLDGIHAGAHKSVVGLHYAVM